MYKKEYIQIEKDLYQIVNMLLLNGTLTECPGLVNGKMGIVVFFFHYTQFSGNELFADYAMTLIDETLDQIHVNSSADYEKGLAGIGVGFDYLIRNNFLSIEDDICEDFDQRMVRAVMYDPWQDFSLYRGLIGYGRYWITRLHNQDSEALAQKCLSHIVTMISETFSEISIFEQMDVFCFLSDLQRVLGLHGCTVLLEQFRRKWNLQSSNIIQSFSRLEDSVVSNIVCAYYRNKYFNNTLQREIDVILRQIPDLDMVKAPTGTGLLKGYAGEGMLRLTALDQTKMSWIDLL